MSVESLPTPEKPKLVEQLKLLREEWGEGFDEDIAQPLALIVQTLREAHRAHGEMVDESIARVEEERDLLSEKLDACIDRGEILEDFADVERGVRTVEEVIAKWTLPIVP